MVYWTHISQLSKWHLDFAVFGQLTRVPNAHTHAHTHTHTHTDAQTHKRQSCVTIGRIYALRAGDMA